VPTIDLSDPVATFSARPSLTAAPGGFVATWVDVSGTTGAARVMTASISLDGGILGRFPVASAVSVFGTPRVTVAGGGDGVLFAWVDARTAQATAAVFDSMGLRVAGVLSTPLLSDGGQVEQV